MQTETKLLAGLGSERILDAARDIHADMIVMGATGTSKLSRLLIGSTTAAVIRDADCPVLCIPKEAKFNGINRIAFATDLQEDNLASAMTVTPFAAKFGAELSFIYVDDKHLLHSDEAIEEMTRRIRRREVSETLGLHRKEPQHHERIGDLPEKQPADLLVMFTHPRRLGETLLTRVSPG